MWLKNLPLANRQGRDVPTRKIEVNQNKSRMGENGCSRNKFRFDECMRVFRLSEPKFPFVVFSFFLVRMAVRAVDL